MKAIVLEKQQYLEKNPLRFKDVPTPEPKDDEIRININICGACRTDLHIVEGELPAHKMPVIIGHQIVGRVDKLGKSGNLAIGLVYHGYTKLVVNVSIVNQVRKICVIMQCLQVMMQMVVLLNTQ